MRCFKRGQWRFLAGFCGLSLTSACAVDNRPGAIAADPPGNVESADLPNGAAAGSGASPSVAAMGAPPTLDRGNPDAGTSSGTVGANSGSGGASAVSGSDPGEVDPIGGCFQQLLPNGGFERGHVAWTETADVRGVILRADDAPLFNAGVKPQSGNYLAWIGGVPNGDFQMHQTMLRQEAAVPAEAISLTFSGYAALAQPDPGEPLADWAVLEVEDPDPNSNGVWQIQRWEAPAPTVSWSYFEVTTTDATILSRLAGHTVPVVIYSVPNAKGTLSVWLDSLRLVALCPR